MNAQTINDGVTMPSGGGGTMLAGRYRIVRQLGQGGMGSVWLAEDTQLDNKPFAIKMLPSILVSNKRAYRQLKDEALVAMKLVHPNIVTLRAFEENNGNPFLVMDYIDGETLDDYLCERGTGNGERGSGLSEEETIRVLRPVAAALDYAHSKGVVHRDVKPGNVMIAKDGTPYILDFGIAREIQETLTRVTGKLSSGTLLYMSPEQLNGDTPKAPQDVYSFAAMAYECLKGEPPFVRGAIEDQIKNKAPEPLSGGTRFVASVMAGLAKKPEDRPKSCVAVLEGDDSNRASTFAKATAAREHAGRVETGGRLPSAAVGGTEDGSRKERKERKAEGWKVLAILALLGALGGGGWWYYAQQQEAERREQARIAAEQRAEITRKAKVGADRIAREKAETEQKAKAAPEQRAAEERRREEEAVAQRADAERKAKAEADRIAREKAETERKSKTYAVEPHNSYQANAIVRLLNSRASGSPKGYAEAAEELAADAAAGKALQGFVLAIVSREPDAPPAARLDDATRERYLTLSREKIRNLAHRTNNSLAWYLLSIDSGDTNLLQRAALGGNVQALNAWGSLLVNNVASRTRSPNERTRILGEAVEFFKRAAGHGDANGLYNLGMCYARGLGTPRDDEKAFSCFRSAAEKGHPDAINNIGWFFREGRIVGKDLELSTKWFKKSADYQNAYGEYNYGLALHRGEGIKRDDAEAARYFKRAADGGCVEALNSYALALLRGEGVEKNELEAIKTFERAAATGFSAAMENLAYCYEKGKGVKSDDKKAMLWRIRAKAARGDRASQAWLRQYDKERSSEKFH